MHQLQRQKTATLLAAKGIDSALFASPDSVKWLTGFAAPIQLGQHPFSGSMPLVWYADQHFHLMVVNAYADDASVFAQEPDGSVITYEGYTIQQPINPAPNLAAAFRPLLSATTGKIGIEMQFVTALLQNLLPATSEIINIDQWLIPLRMIKIDEEIAKLRENFMLTDVGHAAARAAMRSGIREIDMWNVAQTAINAKAGYRVPLGNDCVVGYRQNNIGGFPKDHVIRPNDGLILDLSTIHEGYWSDSCATYYADTPTPVQAAMHRVVQDALDFAIALIRPGVKAKEVDQKVRGFIEKAGYPVYPHHTGHGVGVAPHEAPRIVPYNEEILEAGMVIMLEPGIYLPGETGVRLEDGLLITDDGVEILTTHDKRPNR